MNPLDLALYDNARTALAEVHRIDEVKKIVDKAAATAEYARRANDGELLGYAAAIRLHAERRAGELLAEMADSGERVKGGDPKSRPATLATLGGLGVTKTQSSRWQALARLDEDEFEARAAAAKRAAVASTESTPEERAAEKKNRRQAREADLGQRQAALPDRRYGVIVADPEWRFEPYSRETGMDRSADNHYPTSATEVIAMRDVASIAAADCALFLWATVPMLQQALAVMEAWGFSYVSNYVWTKNKAGTGYWSRNQHEHLLLGVKGNLPAPAPGTQWSSVIVADAREHSRKPDIVYEMIEAYYPTLARIELNARRPTRKGWTAWGNESERES